MGEEGERPCGAAGMMSGIADGWAVVEPGGSIDIKTVSEHERGAIVNWLWARCGMKITMIWTDEMIYQAWDERHGLYEVMPVRVSVKGRG